MKQSLSTHVLQLKMAEAVDTPGVSDEFFQIQRRFLRPAVQHLNQLPTFRVPLTFERAAYEQVLVLLRECAEADPARRRGEGGTLVAQDHGCPAAHVLDAWTLADLGWKARGSTNKEDGQEAAAATTDLCTDAASVATRGI